MKNRFRLFVLTCIFSLCAFPPAALNAEDKLLALGIGQTSNAEDKLSALNTGQTISMDLQDANLKDVLKIFSIQSGLNFIAAENVEDRQITLYLDKVPMKEAMNKLFEANNLTYNYDKASNIFIVQFWGESEIATITKVYKLKHRSLSGSTLEKEKGSLFEITAGKSQSAAKTAGSESPIAATIKQVLSRNGKISEDPMSNSLIITDIPSRFQIVDELIANLDLPQPQVMLEVEMLDVDKKVMDNIGFQLGGNPLTLALPTGLALSKASYFFGDSTVANQPGGLTLGGKYALLLDFITQQTDTKYLARPRILTMNNETAEIAVTKDEIVSVKTTITGTGDTRIEDTTYERATSLSLTSEGIGIFLRVTPQVNLETDEIIMVVNPKTSSATQSERIAVEDQIALDPEVRSTKSIVKIKDGETVVLGGMIHYEKNEINRKIPFLGDIPLLGALFRHKYVEKNQERELLVFITPHIVRDKNIHLAQNTPANEKKPTFLEPLLDSDIRRKDAIEKTLNVYNEK